MNETLNLLENRRSASAQVLQAPGPDREQLTRLLTVAARVPDHGKIVPWRFIVFEGAARAAAGAMIADVYVGANPGAEAKRLEIERKRFSAPVVVAVVSRAGLHPKVPEWEQVLSAGAVCMNLTVAANALGFASCWLTEWYAYDRDVLTRFGLAEHEKIAGFIHVGTAPGPREDRVRPDLSEIVTYFSA